MQPHKVLTQNERRKIGKYLDPCLKWRQQFMPLIFLVEVVMGEETKAATKQLVSNLYNKLEQEYSVTCGYVCACLFLNLVRDFSLLVQGQRIGRNQAVSQMYEDGVEASRLVIRGD